MINPYENINWNNTQHIPSCSHAHCKTQARFDVLIDGGLRHLALSNYHPSEPWYPLADFFTVPTGIIGSPNAEFSSMDIPSMHINEIGGTYSEPEPAPSRTWKYKISKMLENMQYPDGGGITINHPTWSIETAQAGGQRYLKKEDVFEILDFDQRVLGIEFYNALAASGFPEQQRWSIGLWDEILLTGRRCWGFCVSDHDGEREDGEPWRGRNILLIDSFSEHDCLKAYRNGQFYGSIYNTSLKFSAIELVGNSLVVSAIDADYINIVVDGVISRYDGNSVSFTIPSNAIYVRAEAHNVENSIFSNPIIFRPFVKKDNTDAENLLLLFNP